MNFFSSGFHFKNEVEFDGSAWIWWIRKKKWFKAQQIKGDVNPCFIQISKYQVLILHNFGLIEYTFVNGSISYIETEIESIDLKFFKSCALFFEKNYQRLIIAMGFSVRKIPYECSTLSQTFFFRTISFFFKTLIFTIMMRILGNNWIFWQIRPQICPFLPFSTKFIKF